MLCIALREEQQATAATVAAAAAAAGSRGSCFLVLATKPRGCLRALACSTAKNKNENENENENKNSDGDDADAKEAVEEELKIDCAPGSLTDEVDVIYNLDP